MAWKKYYIASMKYIRYGAICLYYLSFKRYYLSITSKMDKNDAFIKVGRPWARHTAKIFEFDIKVIGLERWRLAAKSQLILIANHRSFFDQFILAAVSPASFLMPCHEKYLKIPVLGGFLKFLGFFGVKKGKLSKEDTLKVKEHLSSGTSFAIYPEGTRGYGNKLLPFRGGAFQWAAQANAPILPLYIFNSEQVMSKRRSLFDLNPADIIVVVGNPVTIRNDFVALDMKKAETDYAVEYQYLYSTYESKPNQESRYRETNKLFEGQI